MALLGAEHRRLLLSPPDEQHALVGVKAGQVGQRQVVLTLTRRKAHQVDTLVSDETVDVGYEPFRDGVHQRRGHEREAPAGLEEADHAKLVLEPGLVEVEVHTVDAFDLEGHVLAENLGDAAR